MQTAPLSAGPPEIPANTGHTFAITASSYKGCQECHPLPEMLTEFAQTVVSNQIQQVKAALDLWATTKAPGALTKYQARAWEYTTPGTLSILPAGTTNVAPSSAEQALIPDNIKKARFNLYIVFHDGSYGVHNGRFATTLLTDAMTMIQQEMKK